MGDFNRVNGIYYNVRVNDIELRHLRIFVVIFCKFLFDLNFFGYIELHYACRLRSC